MNEAQTYLEKVQLEARIMEMSNPQQRIDQNRNKFVNLDFLKELDCVPESKTIGCDHIKGLYPQVDRASIIRQAVNALKPHKEAFEAIAVSGYSSSLIGSILADRLKKNLIVVRKDSEERISNYLIEGIPFQPYIYVDDLIQSGDTLKRVYQRCNEFLKAPMYGVYIYHKNFLGLHNDYSIGSLLNNFTVKFLGATC